MFAVAVLVIVAGDVTAAGSAVVPMVGDIAAPRC